MWIWISEEVGRIREEMGRGNYNWNILYEKNVFNEKETDHSKEIKILGVRGKETTLWEALT